MPSGSGVALNKLAVNIGAWPVSAEINVTLSLKKEGSDET